MNTVFDIAEDELQIFLAEVDEHLQTLDEGLVQLERTGGTPELLQAIFRAAHTLKGSAGMIGHRRMADLTHAMETALDGLRKGTLAVSTPLVDACLEALDALKLLRNEVADGEIGPVDIAPLADRLSALGRPAITPPAAPPPSPVPAPAREQRSVNGRRKAKGSKRTASNKQKAANSRRKAGKSNGRAPAASNGKTRSTLHAPPSTSDSPGLLIRADIAEDSIASAARAFQIVLALQALGEVHDLQPPQSVIETAAPVRQLTARLATDKSGDEIRQAIAAISEIERLAISGEEISLTPAPPAPPKPQPDESSTRLGEYLVANGYISPDQLKAALAKQAAISHQLLGKTLVEMGALTQETLDLAIAGQIQRLRSALRAGTPAAAASAERRARATEKTVRTSVERLDNLMNLVGELITDRNRLYQIRGDFEGRFRGEAQVENLAQTAIHLGRITDQLQEEVMRIRMLPISNVFSKFPRLARDLARKAGKQADLAMRGEDTELDRSVIEEISDPLIHLLRNAVDHGLETPAERAAAGKPERGMILLTARHEEGRIILTVEDDGRGIDTERVKASAVQKGLIGEAEAAALAPDEAVDLIFKPGLSTAKVVSDVSGRGVGMDIVRTNIERLNGNVVVETRPGRGTRFQIVLPLTLAIIPTMLVQVAGQRAGLAARTFAIPLGTVMEVLRVPASDIQTVRGKPVMQLRGRVLPLVRLGAALGFADTVDEQSPVATRHSSPVTRHREYVMAVRWSKLEMGLVVDSLIGEQELVVKSLGTLVGETPGVSGAAILGDGSVALIADIPGLFKLAGA